MSTASAIVTIRFAHATRQRQLTVALGCVLIAIIAALALLWLLVYQSVIATALGPDDGGSYNTRLEMSWYGSAGQILQQPSGIAFDAQRQRVLVTDSRRAQVSVLTTYCELITTFDGGDSAAFKLELPTSIAVASDGRIFVVDAAAQRIVIFDEFFKPLRTVSFVEEPPKAVAVIADSEGVEHLWVLSFSGLSRGSLDGDIDWGYFARGTDPGQFANPSAVAGLSIDASTTVFVADTFNYRVQALDVERDALTFQWLYGGPAAMASVDQTDAESLDGITQEKRLIDVPIGVATDGVDRVFVLDGMGATILTLDARTGDLITAFGAVGSQEGQLLYPSAIAFGDERIWVVDQGNARVAVYAQSETTGVARLARQQFPLELLWLLVSILFLVELGCLIWLATIRASRLVFSMGALERIDDRERGDVIAEVVEHLNVVAGMELYAREVCPQARVATAPMSKRSLAVLAPLREHLSPLDFDTLVAARSLSRSVLVDDSQTRLFTAALEAGVPVIDITELIGYADALVEDEGAGGFERI
jgi:DNA-binding beta-propeller fold protein YncE